MIGAPPLTRRARLLLAALLAAGLSALAPSPGSGYTLIRTVSFTAPPASWPIANLPLPTLINSAGSDNVPGSSDIDAIIAGENTWTKISTDYFVFAAPVVGGGTALNTSDGKNSIFFDEPGANFPAGDTTIAFTALNINGSTGVISDADLVFNGRDFNFSTTTPTPVTMNPPTYDIQSIATHEQGHMTGLDHSALLAAVMFPYLEDGTQYVRSLASDDRLADSFLYPESSAGAGIAGLQSGDGDLNQITGSIAGVVQTSGGTPVPGAQVVAVDPYGAAVVSDVSHPDGSYLLTGLAPGGYQVYAEPLDGVVFEQDASQGDHSNAFLSFATTFLGGNATPSTVTVSAGATGSGNTVSLGSLYGVETEANNTSGAANPVALEALTSGISQPATDLDYFSFAVPGADFVSIDVDASGDGLPFDPVITLYSTNGSTVLGTNDDFDLKGNDSRIVRKLAAAGTYYVRVEDFTNLPGGPAPVGGPGFFYTVHVNRALAEVEPNGTSGTASSSAIGQYRGGFISTNLDVDYYSFAAKLGDRILADVTADRSGSLLNSVLTLYDTNGSTVLATSNNISTTDFDSFIDYSFTNPSNATYYLRVSQTLSTGGSGSFYVLHIGTDSLNTFYSWIAPPGSGVSGHTASIFPKFVPQGAGFDLVVAGLGIPPDSGTTMSVTGPGVTLSDTAGLRFDTFGGLYDPTNNPFAGTDLLALSASVSGSAPPGPRTVFTQNATLKAALSGGLVITPVGVPPETAPASSPLNWSGGQMVWTADPSASLYNVYRGNLSGLIDLNQDGIADSYGSAFACGVTAPVVADPAVPPLEDGFFYLVAGVNANGEGTLGTTRNDAGPGPARPKSALNPSCP